MSAAPRSPDVILSAVIAALVFGVAFLFLDLGIIWSLVLTAVAFAVGAVFLKTKSEAQESRESTEKTLLQNGYRQKGAIEDLKDRISRPDIARKVEKILAVLGKILETLEEDKTKIRSSVQFLDYYLNTTVKVLTVWLNIADKDVQSGEIQETLSKFESSLDTLANGFEGFLAKLLSQDADSLSTELKVLEQNLAVDGLINPVQSAGVASSVQKQDQKGV